MTSIYDNIISKFLNEEVEIGGKIAAMKQYYSDKGYKLGEYKNLSLPSFDVNKVVKALKWKEVPYDEIAKAAPGIKGSENSDGELVFGISNPKRRIFGIHETITNWIPVLFHEFGHMYLRHDKAPVSIFEQLFFGGGVTQESEAELFSYFALTKLGAKVDFQLEAHNLKNYKGMIGELPAERIKEIEDKAGEFIALGRVDN